MEESRKDTRVAGTCQNDVSLFGIAAMMNDTYFPYEIIFIVMLFFIIMRRNWRTFSRKSGGGIINDLKALISVGGP